jgi:hypothetical protein
MLDGADDGADEGRDAAPDAAIDAPLVDAARDVLADAQHETGIDCVATLTVGTVMSTPASCWIDEKVSQRSAVLRFPCGGGSASADFAVTFTGSVVAGQVDIAATTTFPWGDGCTWESQQRIVGPLWAGELTYTYSEHPISGSGCEPAVCTAKTAVAVH